MTKQLRSVIGHLAYALRGRGFRACAYYSRFVARKNGRQAVVVADNLMDLMLDRATHCGDKTAYTFLENGEEVSETIDYADFAQRVLSLAATLQQRCSP